MSKKIYKAIVLFGSISLAQGMRRETVEGGVKTVVEIASDGKQLTDDGTVVANFKYFVTLDDKPVVAHSGFVSYKDIEESDLLEEVARQISNPDTPNSKYSVSVVNLNTTITNKEVNFSQLD